MLLAIATIEGITRKITPPTGHDIAATLGAIGVPILVLLVPLLDVVLAIIRRTRRGQGIGYADKEHLHHHLMEIGHGHRQAVLLMYLWSALVSGCALAVAAIRGPLAVGLILLAAALFLFTALPGLTRGRKGNGTRGGGPPAPSGGPDAQPGNVSDLR
jgi:UDP-GlcNAc:undecaprenyl-phosphate GlcNAc-1-phosphate transferase